MISAQLLREKLMIFVQLLEVWQIGGTDLLFWLPRVPSLLNGELYARATPPSTKHTHPKSTQMEYRNLLNIKILVHLNHYTPPHVGTGKKVSCMATKKYLDLFIVSVALNTTSISKLIFVALVDL